MTKWLNVLAFFAINLLSFELNAAPIIYSEKNAPDTGSRIGVDIENSTYSVNGASVFKVLKVSPNSSVFGIIKKGDYVYGIMNYRFTKPQDFIQYIHSVKPGSTFMLLYLDSQQGYTSKYVSAKTFRFDEMKIKESSANLEERAKQTQRRTNFQIVSRDFQEINNDLWKARVCRAEDNYIESNYRDLFKSVSSIDQKWAIASDRNFSYFLQQAIKLNKAASAFGDALVEHC
jgi:hypothetical protein